MGHSVRKLILSGAFCSGSVQVLFFLVVPAAVETLFPLISINNSITEKQDRKPSNRTRKQMPISSQQIVTSRLSVHPFSFIVSHSGSF